MLQTLRRSLANAGKLSETLVAADGSRLLLLPYGARVLGLFAVSDDHNFYWTNPLLDKAETARELFARQGWHNTGGDRTWIAPELDLFFPDVQSTRYWQPRALDMSDYAVTRVGAEIQLCREMTLHLARPNRDIRLRLAKWFGPAANPLRHERDMATIRQSLQYAGYTQRVDLQSLDPRSRPCPAVGIWNLMQLPPGGEMLVPLYGRTVPQRCFGDVPSNRIIVDDRLLRVRIDFAGSHKIAVKGASLCGRTGYVYREEGRWSLLIRNFSVNPSGQYVDVQRHDPGDLGYAFQLCRVDEAEFGSFCEMEYHAPALGSLPDPTQSIDVSQVWAFRGSPDTIRAVAERLLGANL